MQLLHFLSAGYISRQIGLFDAGSTGTRFTVYTFIDHNLDTINQYREACPLDKLTSDETKDCLTKLIHRSGITAGSPLALYATAGLRRLPEEIQQAIMEEVRMALKGHNLKEASVLSGSNEALYLLKAFEHLNPNVNNFMLLDMGGKSTQVVRRNGNNLHLSSLPLGMTDAICDNVPATISSYTCSDLTPLYAMNQVENIPNQNIFLFSGFYELLKEFGSTTRMSFIRRYFGDRCLSCLYGCRFCQQLSFVIKLLEKVGIDECKKLIISRYLRGIDVNWSLGKALELNSTLAIEGDEYYNVVSNKKGC